jgi:hypothetical protein
VAAIHKLPGGETVFAGQRNDGFLVDLGAIFDLADLRPFQNLHLIPSPAAPGVDATKTLNIHTIALQIPISRLTANGQVPRRHRDPGAVLGVWSAASRRKVRMIDAANDEKAQSGPWVQVSRLGNPLFNEVLIPLGLKDKWNTLYPAGDEEFLSHVQHPGVANLLPVLYPGVFPRLADLKRARADRVAILLTGIPPGLIKEFQNYTGPVLADQLRLNVAIAPTQEPNPFGLLGGDLAGFPNGRRVVDDVVSIELRAIAGVTFQLIDPKFKPDGAADRAHRQRDARDGGRDQPGRGRRAPQPQGRARAQHQRPACLHRGLRRPSGGRLHPLDGGCCAGPRRRHRGRRDRGARLERRPLKDEGRRGGAGRLPAPSRRFRTGE